MKLWLLIHFFWSSRVNEQWQACGRQQYRKDDGNLIDTLFLLYIFDVMKEAPCNFGLQTQNTQN